MSLVASRVSPDAERTQDVLVPVPTGVPTQQTMTHIEDVMFRFIQENRLYRFGIRHTMSFEKQYLSPSDSHSCQTAIYIRVHLHGTIDKRRGLSAEKVDDVLSNVASVVSDKFSFCPVQEILKSDGHHPSMNGNGTERTRRKQCVHFAVSGTTSLYPGCEFGGWADVLAMSSAEFRGNLTMPMFFKVDTFETFAHIQKRYNGNIRSYRNNASQVSKSRDNTYVQRISNKLLEHSDSPRETDLPLRMVCTALREEAFKDLHVVFRVWTAEESEHAKLVITEEGLDNPNRITFIPTGYDVESVVVLFGVSRAPTFDEIESALERTENCGDNVLKQSVMDWARGVVYPKNILTGKVGLATAENVVLSGPTTIICDSFTSWVLLGSEDGGRVSMGPDHHIIDHAYRDMEGCRGGVSTKNGGSASWFNLCKLIDSGSEYISDQLSSICG